MDNSQFVFKEGHGTASNACYWKVCYDKYSEIYTAMLSFGGAGGSSTSFYIISKAIFDKVGTFVDDDYKSERLIETGELLYRCDDSKYAPRDERVFNPNWKSICWWGL